LAVQGDVVVHAREVVADNVRAVDLVVHLLVDNNVLVIVVEHVEDAKGIVRDNVMVVLEHVVIHAKEIVLDIAQVAQEVVLVLVQGLVLVLVIHRAFSVVLGRVVDLVLIIVRIPVKQVAQELNGTHLDNYSVVKSEI
jgi:hypothetical protein